VDRLLDILETAADGDRNGRPVALCAIVATRGSSPQPAGTLVCVDEDANMTGTLGGGCMEAEVRNRARAALVGGTGGVATFDLDFTHGLDEGMICGGHVDVAISVVGTDEARRACREAADSLRAGRPARLPLRVETTDEPVEYVIHLEAQPKLLIAGGGHIGKRLAGLMADLDFAVTVIDDRQEYANPGRFPPPIVPVVGDIEAVLSGWPIDTRTYVVIVTRGHQRDERALAAVVHSPACYVGMIGSRRKIDVVFNDLRQCGVTDDALARVYAPIGLDIHAVTPGEIAVSIAAQLVRVRRQRRPAAVEGPFSALTSPRS